MSTLQRLENVEKAVSELKGLADLIVRLPRLEQDVTNFAKSVQELIGQTNNAFGQQGQMLQTVANQNVSLEQSVIKLGRVITSLSEELFEAKILSPSNVNARLQSIEEDVERNRIQNMLTYKAIQPSEVVNASSTVVVSETFTAKAEGSEKTTKQMSEYRVLEMSSQYNDSKIISDFIGKKNGDTVTVEIEEGTISLTVKEIYDYAQKIEGGVEATEQAQVENEPSSNT